MKKEMGLELRWTESPTMFSQNIQRELVAVQYKYRSDRSVLSENHSFAFPVKKDGEDRGGKNNMGIRGLSSPLLLLFLLLSSPSPFFSSSGHPPVCIHILYTRCWARAHTVPLLFLLQCFPLSFSAQRVITTATSVPRPSLVDGAPSPSASLSVLALGLRSSSPFGCLRTSVGEAAGRDQRTEDEDGRGGFFSLCSPSLSPAAASFLLLLVLFWRRRVGESGDGVPPPSALLPLLLCTYECGASRSPSPEEEEERAQEASFPRGKWSSSSIVALVERGERRERLG